MSEADFKKITVVGLGLIGASFAMALQPLSPEKVFGIDIDPQAVRQAESMGIIHQGYTDGHQALSQSDLVIIALYPGMTVDFIKREMDHFKRGAVITDTAGIKGKVLAEILPVLRPDLDFIGGHPMAGNAGSGLGQAEAKIFPGTNYILTLTEKNRPANVARLEKLIIAMGCRQVVHLTAAEHDQIISYVSQLPHVLAVSLINANPRGQEIGSFAGGSFRDATRVAEINAPLWSELLVDNGENIIRQIEGLQSQLGDLKKAIRQGNRRDLQNILERADTSRRVLTNGSDQQNTNQYSR